MTLFEANKWGGSRWTGFNPSDEVRPNGSGHLITAQRRAKHTVALEKREKLYDKKWLDPYIMVAMFDSIQSTGFQIGPLIWLAQFLLADHHHHGLGSVAYRAAVARFHAHTHSLSIYRNRISYTCQTIFDSSLILKQTESKLLLPALSLTRSCQVNNLWLMHTTNARS